MAVYTKEQLKEAYFLATETNPSIVMNNDYFVAEIIRVQAVIDEELSKLQTRKAEVTTRLTERVNRIQTRIDSTEPDAKEQMKDIALKYLADQAEEQSDTDNSGVSL